MKRLFSIAITAIACMGIVGCNSKSAPPAQEAVPEAEMPSPEDMMNTTTDTGGSSDTAKP